MADQYQLPPSEEPSAVPGRSEPTIPVENVPPPPLPGRRRRDQRWLPLLLIGGGILLFLGNTGVFASVAWSVLLPLAMLAVGLDLITEGRNRRRIAVGALVAAPLLVLLVGGASMFDRGPAMGPSMGDGSSRPVSLEGIENIRVEVKHSEGNLVIDALDDEDDAFALDYTTQRFRREGATGIIDMDMSGWQGGNAELRLPPNMPLDMRIEVDGGNAEPIDLRELELERLELVVSAGNTKVLLPEQGVMNVTVNSTAGNVELQVPDELQARIEAASSFGNVRVDDHFEQRDGVYFSPDYDASSPDHATLKLTSTAGSNVEVEVE